MTQSASKRQRRSPMRIIGALTCTLVLAACAEEDVILEGERLDVRGPLAGSVSGDLFETFDDTGAPDAGFTAPPVTQGAAWTHPSGSPTHRAPHPSFSGSPSLAWTASIGIGNTRRHRITGRPIVAGGLIFAMDSQSQVTAVSLNGEPVWSRNLTPPEERSQDASGGGVAFAQDRIYATTGFGEVVALDAATGTELWRQSLDAPATAAPTVLDGIVYAVGRDNRAWAINAADGRVRWQLPGTPDISGVVGGASPAVNDQVAIFPFGSGELVAALRRGGVRLWGSSVSGKRQGRAYANISDITADPVIAGDVVYTANQSGRAVALSLRSGERLWTARNGAVGTVAVAGNSVFMITDQLELVRLSAETGQQIWTVPLPFLRRETSRRAKAVFGHFGPQLAGGLLWVASDDGILRGFDPASGAERNSVEVPGGAASGMAFASGTMYVLSGRGELLAYR